MHYERNMPRVFLDSYDIFFLLNIATQQSLIIHLSVWQVLRNFLLSFEFLLEILQLNNKSYQNLLLILHVRLILYNWFDLLPNTIVLFYI